MTLTRNQSRTLAVIVLLVAVALVATVLIGPLWWLHHRYDTYNATTADQVRRFQRLINARPQFDARLADLRARKTENYFLKTASPALAASEVQDLAKQIIEGTGARLIAVQIAPHRDDGKYRQITVNLQISANVIALSKALQALESSIPYLLVDNLTVRAQTAFNYRPAPGVEPEMFVQFDVSGFAADRAPGTPPGQAPTPAPVQGQGKK